MRLNIFIIFSLFIIGCSEDYSNLPKIDVDFTWPEKNVVSISPKITLNNVPENTTKINIDMFDLDNRHQHGGGTISYNGTKYISEGTLKEYQGPSPLFGSPRYEISVKAINENGVIIAFGKKMKRYPAVSK